MSEDTQKLTFDINTVALRSEIVKYAVSQLISMGCAPTYEDACRAAEAAINRRIANRMAVM